MCVCVCVCDLTEMQANRRRASIADFSTHIALQMNNLSRTVSCLFLLINIKFFKLGTFVTFFFYHSTLLKSLKDFS